jgi:hypothetical protein
MCQLTSGRVADSGSESDGQQDGDGRLLEDERGQRQVGDVRGHDDGGDAAGNRRDWSRKGESLCCLAELHIMISRIDRDQESQLATDSRIEP